MHQNMVQRVHLRSQRHGQQHGRRAGEESRKCFAFSSCCQCIG